MNAKLNESQSAEAAPERPHYSASQVDMFSRCPQQWYRRYVCGDKRPPGIALILGTAVHEGVGANMLQKVESHEDLAASDVEEVTAEAFDGEAKGGVELNPDEVAQGEQGKVALGNAKDMAVRLAGLHTDRVAPKYQPTHVEQVVNVPVTETHDMLGYIDLITDDGAVLDTKTASKSLTQNDADKSTQLTFYSAAAPALIGRRPSLLALDVLVKTKTPKYVQVATTRDDRDYEILGRRIEVMATQIEAGIFPPALPTAWWCNARWCGYAHDCPYYKTT